jgi:hypothetical protein
MAEGKRRSTEKGWEGEVAEAEDAKAEVNGAEEALLPSGRRFH